MTNAEHLIENLILGMKEGRDPRDILEDKCNVWNLSDCSMSKDEAVAVACHVVYTLYDGIFPAGVDKTRGKEVRSTQDEGLAELLWIIWYDGWRDGYFAGQNRKHMDPKYPTTREKWSEWVKEKVNK